MLSTHDITVRFGARTVLDSISLTLHAGVHCGLVGSNGSGKTTLMKVLAGEMEADSGSVSLAKSKTLAYLPQQINVSPEQTVMDLCEEGFNREHQAALQRDAIAERLKDDPYDTKGIQEVSRIDTFLEDRGYHQRHVEIHRVLHGLGFPAGDEMKRMGSLSGGWRMRAALARTLLSRPDILLLDEPTNYLDSEAREWLRSFIRSFPGAIILVSHDRLFLDETIQEIIELFDGAAHRYKGTYTEYERRRRLELEQRIQAWEEQQQEIARQEEFIRRFRAQANRASQVQSRVKLLERMEKITIPDNLRPVQINMPPAPRSGDVVLELEEVSHTYGQEMILKDVSIALRRGQRLAVVGRNGAGKTTLLRILSQIISPTHGHIRRGQGVVDGYFAQESPEQLPAEKSVLEHITSLAADANSGSVRDVLGAFLFSGDDVYKPLSVLSGGERSRLVMAGLLIRPVNLLILDEPTNHLDISSQEVLARALRQYTGTVILVSHDRYFLRQVTTDVLALYKNTSLDAPPNHWKLYPGSYQEFEESAQGRSFFLETDEPEQGQEVKAEKHTAARAYDDQKAHKQEIRRLEREDEQLVELIATHEAALKEIHTAMAEEANYSDRERFSALQAKLNRTEEELSLLLERWEAVNSRLSEISI